MLIPGDNERTNSIDQRYQPKTEDFLPEYSEEGSASSHTAMATEALDIRPTDIVIAVMGVTGSGKSTFISHFADGVTIGHTLEACTSNVGIYQCAYNDKTKVFFVDTPGFDDTYRSDTDILREVADWLSRAYANKIQLTGIIYLHRILDVRLGGSAMRNLRMFKKLCGDNALASVVLATTWWSGVDEDTGNEREKQLKTKPDFWAGMISKGSKVFRQDSDEISARTIVDYLIQRKRPVVLNIQQEMVNNKMTLDQTAAGSEVGTLLIQQRKEFEKRLKEIQADLRQALKEKDSEYQEELKEYRKQTEEKIRKAKENRVKLQTNWEELRQQRDAELLKEREQLQEQTRLNMKRLAESEIQLRLMKAQHASDMQKQKLEFQLLQERNERARLQKKLDAAKCVVM